MKSMVVDSVKRLAGEYNFDANQALASLNIDAAKVNRKAMPKRQPGAPKEAKEKKTKVPLPFSCYPAEWTGCQGLSNNHGLFTPCEGAKAEGATYCAKCQTQAEKNANGLPDCGTVEQRQTLGAAFKDPKGRKPAAYTRALEAVKVSIEQAMEYAQSKGIEIPAEDLIVVEKKTRGRPQAAAPSATAVDGIFGEAIADAASNSDGSTASKAKKPKMTEEEKKAATEKREADKKAKEESAAKLKTEMTTAKALASIGRSVEQIVAEGVSEEVAQKAVIDHAEALQKKAEAAAKRKADAQAKKELEQKVKADALAKAAAAAPVVQEAAPVVQEVAPVVQEAAPAAKPKPVRFTYSDGNKYVRSPDGRVFNNELTIELGTWNAETKTIEFYPEDDEDEEVTEEVIEESD